MFGNDKKLEAEEGIRLVYGEFSIKIARAGGANQKYARKMRSSMKPYKHQIDMGTITEETAQGILADVYADSVILDWDGVKGPDGKVLPFTKENVKKLLLDLPDLFKDIQKQAENFANFRPGDLEEEVKKFEAPSDGN